MDNFHIERFIHSDPDIMLGKPVVIGTRLTVESVLERLAVAESIVDVCESHPALTPEVVRACIAFAAQALHVGTVYPVTHHA